MVYYSLEEEARQLTRHLENLRSEILENHVLPFLSEYTALKEHLQKIKDEFEKIADPKLKRKVDLKRALSDPLPLVHIDDYADYLEEYYEKLYRKTGHMLDVHGKKLTHMRFGEALAKSITSKINSTGVSIHRAVAEVLADPKSLASKLLDVYKENRKRLVRDEEKLMDELFVFPHIKKAVNRLKSLDLGVETPPMIPLAAFSQAFFEYSVVAHPKVLSDPRFRKRVKNTYANLLEAPPIKDLTEEELAELLNDPELLSSFILAYRLSPEAMEKIMGFPPAQRRKVLRLLKDPSMLQFIHSSEVLPESFFHPDVMEKASNLSLEEKFKLINALAANKEVFDQIEPKKLARKMEYLAKQPVLGKYVKHPLLFDIVDVLADAYKKNRQVLEKLQSLEDKHYSKHTTSSLRYLIQSAVKYNNPDIIDLMVEHPDLISYYEVFARLPPSKLREIEELLNKKEKWKGVHPYTLEQALKHPLGIRILLSDLSISAKEKLVDKLEEGLTEKDIRAYELADRYRLDTDVVRYLIDRLGREGAEDFLSNHRHLLGKMEGPVLESAIKLWEQKGYVSPEEVEVLRKLHGVAHLSPSVAADAAKEIVEKELSSLFLSFPDDVIKNYFRYVAAGNIRKLLEHLTYLARQRRPVKRERIEKDIRLPSREKDIEEFIRKNIVRLGKKTVILRKGLVRLLGLSRNTLKRRAFVQLLRDELSKRVGDKRAMKVLERLGLLEKIERRETSVVDTALSPAERSKLKHYLDSIHRALEIGSIRISQTKEGDIVIRVIKKVHEATAPLKGEFLTLCNRVLGLLGTDRTCRSYEDKVIIPAELIDALASHPLFSRHGLVSRFSRRLRRRAK